MTIDEQIFEMPEGEGVTVEQELSDERRELLQEFANGLGVTFSRLELLNQAMTHKSYAREFEPRLKYNERLEFLGDAVLGLAAGTYLFEHFPNFTEGELTKMRSSVVRQSTLTRLAEELGLDELLQLGPTEVASIRGRASNLEDAMESLIGAIYLEHGWEVARDFVWQKFAHEFEHVKLTGIPKDYKSKLQEVIQRRQGVKLTYAELSASGPSHMPTFEAAALIDGKIFGRGVGNSKKAAEQEAARATLIKLGELET